MRSKLNNLILNQFKPQIESKKKFYNLCSSKFGYVTRHFFESKGKDVNVCFLDGVYNTNRTQGILVLFYRIEQVTGDLFEPQILYFHLEGSSSKLKVVSSFSQMSIIRPSRRNGMLVETRNDLNAGNFSVR